MVIGERLRGVREKKNLSQGNIEQRTGLLRCYISRVENGHTVPSLANLERLARAFEVPLYQLFYAGEEPPKIANVVVMKPSSENLWGNTGKDVHYFNKLRRLLSKIGEGDRKLVLHMAQKMANR